MSIPKSLTQDTRVAGVEEARNRLPELLNAAHVDGVVTIVTKRGTPFAAIVPVSQALGATAKLTDLQGTVRGCYGDVAQFVGELRDEWR